MNDKNIIEELANELNLEYKEIIDPDTFTLNMYLVKNKINLFKTNLKTINDLYKHYNKEEIKDKILYEIENNVK